MTFTYEGTVVRIIRPSSHDQFRNARQEDKAAAGLASNANNPVMRKLLLRQITDLQPSVNQCNSDGHGPALLQQYKLNGTASSKDPSRYDKGDGATTVADSLDLELHDNFVPADNGKKRAKKPPLERYNAANFDDVTGNEKPRARKNDRPDHDLATHCTRCSEPFVEEEEDCF